MNNITVSLPNADTVTGKQKKATLTFFQINSDLNMRTGMRISFFESDGVTPAIVSSQNKLQQFDPIDVQGTTDGNYVDANGNNLAPVYDDNGNITNGAMLELDWWQSLPLSAALASLPQTVKDALDAAEIKCSDVIYGLLQQSIISKNNQGII